MARSFIRDILGPGLLFAGAAVGVSHLVQSTTAGNKFALGLLWVVIVANLSKLPAFSFATRYTAATGDSILEGYRRRGVGVIALYAAVTVASMFIVQAAVTATTAGLVNALLGVTTPNWLTCAILLVLCGAILMLGGYALLDNVIKIVVVVFTITTVVATLVVLFRIDFSRLPVFTNPFELSTEQLVFVCALAGWMPAPLDLAVWNSQWTLSKAESSGYRASVRESLLDFKVGYFSAIFLALCFVVLGTWAYGKDMPKSAAAFAHEVITIYGDTLGAWAKYVVGAAAVCVMFSTTITVLDGFPRALAAALGVLRGVGPRDEDNRVAYWKWLIILAAGSVLVLVLVVPRTTFKPFIDFATAVALVTAPMFSVFNHLAMFSPEVPKEHQPHQWLRFASWLCTLIMIGLAVLWVWARFFA